MRITLTLDGLGEFYMYYCNLVVTVMTWCIVMFVVDLLMDIIDEDHVGSEWFWVSFILYYCDLVAIAMTWCIVMFVVDLLRDSIDEDHIDSEWFWVSLYYIIATW